MPKNVVLTLFGAVHHKARLVAGYILNDLASSKTPAPPKRREML